MKSLSMTTAAVVSEKISSYRDADSDRQMSSDTRAADLIIKQQGAAETFLSPSFMDVPTLPFTVSQGGYNKHEFFEESMSVDGVTCDSYRFLDRSMAFEQSKGHRNLFKGASKNVRAAIGALYFSDWFHSFLHFRLRSQIIVLGLFSLFHYIVMAGVLYVIRGPCGMFALDSFADAFYLSVQTIETIGYGLSKDRASDNPWYFDQCWQGAVFLSLQAMVAHIRIIYGWTFLCEDR